MIRLSLIAFTAALLGGAPALADPQMNPAMTTVCLDVGGESLPVVCQMPGSRLDRRDVFCHCPEGQRVDAPVCGAHEPAPPESLAYDKARRVAGRDGTLVGDSFQGRRMCVDLSPR
ncbi:hypothetical protein [Phenylobacterium aquaticum]|uniref:hypothetical protein n=1 Tax=Phenylobacterium aquaticum TaxID=1763816 RepID=UPI0026EEB2BC|nr:hypothetical protein [Phenylobacterium aquaticum]